MHRCELKLKLKLTFSFHFLLIFSNGLSDDVRCVCCVHKFIAAFARNFYSTLNVDRSAMCFNFAMPYQWLCIRFSLPYLSSISSFIFAL